MMSAAKASRSVYQRLRDDIFEGAFAEGEHLGEVSLGARYEVSRTPVREALSRLEQDRIVERVGRNFVVKSRSPEEILEIYEVRTVLEAAAARAAAARRTDLDLVRLRGAHVAMVALSGRDQKEMAAINRRFHESIWSASHNPTLTDLLNRLEERLLRYSATTLGQPGRWEQVLVEHQQLIDAIAARDEASAEKISASHMTAARDLRLKMFGA